MDRRDLYSWARGLYFRGFQGPPLINPQSLLFPHVPERGLNFWQMESSGLEVLLGILVYSLLFFFIMFVFLPSTPLKKKNKNKNSTYAYMHRIGICTTMFVYLLTCLHADDLQVEALYTFFLTFPLVMLFRCILDGEMLVWDISLNRFAEFGSNQEIGL